MKTSAIIAIVVLSTIGAGYVGYTVYKGKELTIARQRAMNSAGQHEPWLVERPSSEQEEVAASKSKIAASTTVGFDSQGNMFPIVELVNETPGATLTIIRVVVNGGSCVTDYKNDERATTRAKEHWRAEVRQDAKRAEPGDAEILQEGPDPKLKFGQALRVSAYDCERILTTDVETINGTFSLQFGR